MILSISRETFIISFESFPEGGGVRSLLYPGKAVNNLQSCSSEASTQSTFPSHLSSKLTQLPSLHVNSESRQLVRVICLEIVICKKTKKKYKEELISKNYFEYFLLVEQNTESLEIVHL